MYTTVHMKPIYTQIHTRSGCQATYTKLPKIATLYTTVHTKPTVHIYTHAVAAKLPRQKMPNNAILYKKPEIYFLHVHIASPTEHAQKPPTI